MPQRAPANIQRYSKAVALQGSMRGEYIIGQALWHCIKMMEKVLPEHSKECQSVADMKLLMEELYPLYMIAQREEERKVKDE